MLFCHCENLLKSRTVSFKQFISWLNGSWGGKEWVKRCVCQVYRKFLHTEAYQVMRTLEIIPHIQANATPLPPLTHKNYSTFDFVWKIWFWNGTKHRHRRWHIGTSTRPSTHKFPSQSRKPDKWRPGQKWNCCFIATINEHFRNKCRIHHKTHHQQSLRFLVLWNSTKT